VPSVLVTGAGHPPVPNLRRVLTGLLPISLGVQAASFVSSVALARVLGASASTDAYFLGLSVPVLVYAILLAGVRLGAIPALTEATTEKAGFARVGSELVSAVLFASVALSVAVTAAAVLVLPLFLPGEADLASLTRLAIVELAPLGVLGAMTGAFGALLAVRRIFAPQVAVMAIEPLVKTVLTLALGHRIGSQALIAGNLLGSTGTVLTLWWLVRRQGIRIKLQRSVRTPFVRSVVRLSVPLLVGQSVLQVNPLVDRAMASNLATGSVTSLELGLRLFLVPTTLLTSILIAPVSAIWAARKLSDGWPALRAGVGHATTVVLTVVPALAVLAILLRRPLVALLYAGGAYSPHSLAETTAVFGLLLIGLPAQVLIVVFATLFVVQKNTVFPMKIAIANVVLNVGLNYLLRGPLGVAGIALSTSLTFTILLLAFVAGAWVRWRAVSVPEVLPALARATLSAVVVTAAALALMAVLPAASSRPRALLVVGVVGLVGLALHAGVLLLTRAGAVRPGGPRLARTGATT
jgi:putative peptidoglycan lipid II flippase